MSSATGRPMTMDRLCWFSEALRLYVGTVCSLSEMRSEVKVSHAYASRRVELKRVESGEQVE